MAQLGLAFHTFSCAVEKCNLTSLIIMRNMLYIYLYHYQTAKKSYCINQILCYCQNTMKQLPKQSPISLPLLSETKWQIFLFKGINPILRCNWHYKFQRSYSKHYNGLQYQPVNSLLTKKKTLIVQCSACCIPPNPFNSKA